jgi:carnosine N-methyltransferase
MSSSQEEEAEEGQYNGNVRAQQPLAAPQATTGVESYHSLSWAYQTYLKDDQEEQSHWEDVCHSYRQYATFAMQQWANHQYRLHSLSEEQRRFLPAGLRQEMPDFSQRAARYKDAAIRNQFCLDCILRHAGQPHSQAPSLIGNNALSFSSDAQMSKVSSVLKSLARDWSVEGKPERDMAYVPILQRVQTYLPPEKKGRICVPGAGVGRLACELSAVGYAVQGNEFSLYMLLASDFILNGPLQPSTPLQISPYLLESRNVHAVNDPLRVVRIPDVDPYTMIMKSRRRDDACGASSSGATRTPAVAHNINNTPTEGATAPPDFSMAAGEFVSIYSTESQRGQWDAVVACFFLDASPSIVECLQVIYQMLSPGGYFFHFGPLLWHWSGPAMRPDDKSVHDYRQRYDYLDPKYLMSIDLSWEDVREIMSNMGFEIVESSTGHHALYTADRRSMMNLHYRCIQFVARKPLAGSSTPGKMKEFEKPVRIYVRIYVA